MTKKSYIEQNAGFITHSKLQDFISCQYRYYLRYEKKVVPDQRTDAMLFGSALDDYFSYGADKFNDKYANVSSKIEDPEGKLDQVISSIQEVEDAIKDAKAKKRSFTMNEKKLFKLKEDQIKLENIRGKEQLTGALSNGIITCRDELNRQPLFQFKQEHAQVEIITNYRGHKLKTKMDNFDEENERIKDLKTSASIIALIRGPYLVKYIQQLAWYQFVVELEKEILCDAELQVVQKAPVAGGTPKSEFFFLERHRLRSERGYLIDQLDRMIDAIDSGFYETATDRREKCFNCPAYGQCPHAVQQEYTIL